MNEDELRNNEKIVDLFSHFLYQALVTAKHEMTTPGVFIGKYLHWDLNS
jgi:hypothetical protein